jgi:hypothetical protein
LPHSSTTSPGLTVSGSRSAVSFLATESKWASGSSSISLWSCSRVGMSMATLKRCGERGSSPRQLSARRGPAGCPLPLRGRVMLHQHRVNMGSKKGRGKQASQASSRATR